MFAESEIDRLHGQSTAPNWQSLGLLQTPSSDSPSSVSSDSDAQSSAASVASSQTSYSSETQWTFPVELDAARPTGKPALPALSTEFASLPNPRRPSRSFQPPSLVRQHERKGQFVYHLVDSATQLVETVWPTSAPACHAGAPQGHQSMLPLRTFIEETLRRSKTSFSTLQVALFYLISLKKHVPAFDFTMEQPDDSPLVRALQCGRRMFLAALILGSKYLQDRNYSARAWSKISGLQVSEINLNERAFLAAVKWELHIPESTFNRWQDILIKYSHPAMVESWKRAIHTLTPEKIAKTQTTTPPFSPQELFKSVTWPRAQPRSPCSPVEIPTSAYPTPSPVSAASPFTLDARYPMQPPAAPSALKLPTPSPMSALCPTPAVSSANDMLRQVSRPRAMCFAINTASNAATARSCIDLAPSAMGLTGAPGRCFSRRSSLASSAGLSSAGGDSAAPSATSSPRSSPGSMVSDHSSRSSSVCSVSSSYAQNTSPARNPLPRLARMNAAYKLVDLSAAAAAPACSSDDSVTILGSGPLSARLTSSPEAIIIEDEATPTQVSYDGVRESRKRHRVSVDSVASVVSTQAVAAGLQDQVRMLMRRDSAAPSHRPRGESNCNSNNSNNNDVGKPAAKKPCFMTEVPGRGGHVLRPRGGPGMWSGILA